MTESIRLLANGKLNLRLKIRGRRSDGYHLLQMITVPVDVYDEVEIAIGESAEGGLRQEFMPRLACGDEKTTIYKAYRFLKPLLPRGIDISVRIKKAIPEGSGMGGGSSDAAFFLNALMERFGVPITEDRMTVIADTVGADVPFFLVNRPAWLEGIGERVHPYDFFPPLSFLVIVPDFGVSTAWAYSRTKTPLTEEGDIIILKNQKIALDAVLSAMENDLEEPVEQAHPAIGEIKAFLRDRGAVRAMMTGSGSAVFGVFCGITCAEEAVASARARFPVYRLFCCSTIGA